MKNANALKVPCFYFAKKNKYGGVTGVTNSSRPAFKLYMSDGWIVDKAFNFGNYQFCWIRRIV